jgi:hypothetical protein
MTRITVGLVVLLAVGLLGRAPAATAPPPKRVPTLGVLLSFSPPAEPEWKQHSVFVQELRTLGWREGENITIEYRWVSGRLQRGVDLAAELVTRHVDVIVVDNRVLGQAVQHVTTTIPIVMLSVDDPVAAGVVASLAQPGGNITGIDDSVTPEISGKLLALLTEAVPAVRQVAVLVDPRYKSLPSCRASLPRPQRQETARSSSCRRSSSRCTNTASWHSRPHTGCPLLPGMRPLPRQEDYSHMGRTWPSCRGAWPTMSTAS